MLKLELTLQVQTKKILKNSFRYSNIGIKGKYSKSNRKFNFICKNHNTDLNHIKAHGALYNEMI